MLTYKGIPLRRIQFLWSGKGKQAMYFVETTFPEMSCVVPLGSIGADGGPEEVIRVASMTRGNILQ